MSMPERVLLLDVSGCLIDATVSGARHLWPDLRVAGLCGVQSARCPGTYSRDKEGLHATGDTTVRKVAIRS